MPSDSMISDPVRRRLAGLGLRLLDTEQAMRELPPPDRSRPVVGEQAGDFKELSEAFEAECRRLRGGIEEALRVGRSATNARGITITLRRVLAGARMP